MSTFAKTVFFDFLKISVLDIRCLYLSPPISYMVYHLNCNVFKSSGNNHSNYIFGIITDEIAISKFVNRTKYCNTNLSDTCTALPSINNLTTTVTFPVNYGTLVPVGCNTGNTLSGDSSITCEKDTAFVYTAEPVCNQGK